MSARRLFRRLPKGTEPIAASEGKASVAQAGEAAPLLERERELELIERYLAAATAGGRGSCLVLKGAPGIGKTSLLGAARSLAGEQGVRVLTARGGELERHVAYGIVRQLFERRLLDAPADERREMLAGAAGFAAPVVAPAAGAERQGPLVPSEDPAATIRHGLYWLVANLAARSPALICVDDVHWADPASLGFLVYLARRIEELPLMILTATRPPEMVEAAGLLDPLEREAATTTAALEPLTPAAGAHLARALAGEGASEEFCIACHEASAGNPYLLREVVSGLRARGIALDASDPRRVADLVPQEVSESIILRLGALPAATTALARAVAVLGTEVELRHAAALAGLELVPASSAADALAAADILAVGTPLEFVHPVVRTAIRDSIPVGERAVLHTRAARVLDADAADAERVAAQLLAAAAVGDVWAIEVLRRAAARSVERGAPDAAVRYLRRALAEPPPAAERPAILAELGKAEVRAGLPDEAAAHLREAMERTSDPRARAAIAHELTIGLIAPGRYREGVEMLEAAAEAAGEVDPELALRLEAELIASARLVPETLRIARRHLERIPRDPEGATQGQRMVLAVLAHEGVHRPWSATRVSELARRAVEGGLVHDLGGDSGVLIEALFPLIVSDDFERAEHAYAEAFEDVRRRGSVIGLARNSAFRSILAYRRGDLAEAETDARRAIEVGKEPGYRIALLAHGPLVDALVARGDLAAADAALADAALDGELPDALMLNFVLHSRGWLRLAQGRIEEAVSDLEEIDRRESKWWGRNPGVFPYRSGLALAALGRGERDRALELAREQLELARAWGTRSAIGHALRTLGLAEGGARMIERLRESVDVLERSGARYELARSLVELGAAIRRSGQRAAARDPLHSGMEVAHGCGAGALVERAHDELVATGARPRRIMRTGVDALTPSELRVARMAAEGMTNREVAQALFVTVRTVEVHLTGCYRKLGIASREELPAALTD